jgi:hypothetical protein
MAVTELEEERSRYIIVQAKNVSQMEQRIIDFMAEGYELHGTLEIDNGVFTQAMIRAKKIIRTSI